MSFVLDQFILFVLFTYLKANVSHSIILLNFHTWSSQTWMDGLILYHDPGNESIENTGKQHCIELILMANIRLMCFVIQAFIRASS